MLKFTVQDQEWLNSQTSVLIDSIALYKGGSDSISNEISDFIGAVVEDESGIGNNLVISFEDRVDAAYTLTRIGIKSGEHLVALSPNISAVKPAGKSISLRIVASFPGAEKCKFNATTINLPYATKSRPGVVRFYNSTDSSSEDQKAFTVLSTADTKSLIETYISGANQYVPWDIDANTDNPIQGSVTVDTLNIESSSGAQTATITIDNSGNFVLNNDITGTAVATQPAYSNGGITANNKLVNTTYISNLYSNSVDTSQNEDPDAAKLLVTSHAVRAYVEDKLDEIDDDYVHKTGAETIAGAKTFSDGVISTSYTGTGIYSSYVSGTGIGGWGNSDNNSKIPTVQTVRSAISDTETAITQAYQLADTGLQSQIDALNAGQNLADIVNTKTALVSHSLTDLKANGDYISGSSGSTWSVGDKIQVLHDTTVMSGTNEGNYDDSTAEKIAAGIATVYELKKGTKSSSDKKDVASATTGYYWHYIGEYGVDCYSKSVADDRYIIKDQLDSTFSSSSSSTNAPSTLAVYNYVSDEIADLENIYVKLNSQTQQSINSDLDITGQVDIDNVTIVDNTVSSSGGIYGGFKLLGNDRATVLSYTDGSDDLAYIEIDGIYQEFTVNLGESSGNALSIDSNTSNNVTTYSVTGGAVADYTDAGLNSETDGRLVTVDYLTNYTTTSAGAYAKLAENNTFASNYTNTFNGGVTLNGAVAGSSVYSTYIDGSNTGGWSEQASSSKIPTVGAVNSAIEAKIDDLTDDILVNASTIDSTSQIPTIGAIGLFVYTEVGAEKGIGETISGNYLKPVGMSLPISGQISYKSATPVPAYTNTTWRLMSLAMKRTSASDPCLVLAQRIS